jgi:hypothetical protein
MFFRVTFEDENVQTLQAHDRAQLETALRNTTSAYRKIEGIGTVLALSIRQPWT